MKSPAIRLFHRDSNRHFIVVGGDVYADRRRVHRITGADRITSPIDGVTPDELRTAADYFAAWYETPINGTPTYDRRIKSAGTLNTVEIRQLQHDANGVPVARTALERHLDFFDSETFDGRITVGENWRGWRRLGYGYFRSLIGTIGAAMVFGRIFEWFAIDIARIKEKRPTRPTGLYDPDGRVNEALLREYLNAFDERCSGGVISQDQVAEIIERKAAPGSVSKRQFKSLFRLCTRLNRNRKVITKEQFVGLFDGSLLYLAASIPAQNGTRRLLLKTVGAPLIVKVAVLVMIGVFAPWSGGLGFWRHLSGWLLVAGSWLLYAILSSRTAVERSVILIVGALAAASVWSALSWNDALAVWPLIILTAAMAIFQQWRPVLQYAFFARFPLLLALTTMALPAIAIWGVPLLFRTLFTLTGGELLFVVLLTVLVAEVSLASALVITRYAHRRFSVTPWPAPASWIERFGRLYALLIALPVIMSVIALSEEPLLSALLSAGAGALAAYAITRFARWLVRGKTNRPEKVRQKVARKLTALALNPTGYVDERGKLLPGHLANAGLLAVTLVLYVIGFFVLKPTSVVQAPGIAFVLFILIMLGWFLPAVSFFADKYRVSTVIGLAVIPAVLYFINDLDHYYRVASLPQTSAAAPSNGSELQTAFDSRLERTRARHPGAEPVIIAVAAGGGGGSAALWSARVLAGLQEEFGPRFTDSIQMISAVSGGSVGTVYVLNAFEPPAAGQSDNTPTDTRMNEATAMAGRSTQSAIAWGLAYPDFWRFFSLRHLDPFVDRGWAMEQVLDANLGADRGITLRQWRDGMLAGWRPAAFFNATVSETGDRLVVSPLSVRGAQECARGEAASTPACRDQIDAYTLRGLYKSNPDLSVATAARLSATFPFVLPLPRPRQVGTGETAYHVADGGYYDNDGLLSLVEWAQKAMEFPSASAARKMLLIDIRVPDPRPSPQRRAGWLYATLGPVLTMLRARTSSQVQRNQVDVKLLKDRRQAGEMAIQYVEFPLMLDTSRSWHLPASERAAINDYWDTDRTVLRARDQICEFLGPSEWRCLSPSTTRFP